jgi:hypothetical protein
MITFKKIPDPTNQFDKTTVVVETESQTLPDLLDDFADFLKGCGFVIPNNCSIQIVEEE